MSLLQGAQKDWQKRISQKDVRQFTVEGKLSMAGLCMEFCLYVFENYIPYTPKLRKLCKTLKMEKFSDFANKRTLIKYSS